MMDQVNTGLTYQGKRRTWGVRFSWTDAVILVMAVTGTIGTYSFTDGYSLLILFVVLHFFLFCNIFRIRRTPELVWAGIFLLNASVWILLDHLSLWGIASTQFVFTVIVIVNEFRNPNYHGVFARQINPHLDNYLSGNN